MSRVQILQVDQAELDSSRLWGGCIDAPSQDARFDSYFVRISGWAFDRAVRPATMVIKCNGEVLATVVADNAREDVAIACPHVPDAGRSGFSIVISTLSLPLDFDVSVAIASPEGADTPIGRIRGRRRALPRPAAGDLGLLLATSLGRSGSTLVQHTLSCHPNIIVRRRFPHESHIALYWLVVFQSLSAPASCVQQAGSDEFEPLWWLGNRDGTVHRRAADEPDMDWLAGQGLEDLAVFCRNRITSFYRHLAEKQGKPRVAWVTEKIPVPARIQRTAWELYPDARELILVRDFRDRCASMLSFRRKQMGNADWRPKDDAGVIASVGKRVHELYDLWNRRRDRVHLLRYEDIILKPEEAWRDTLAYIGVANDSVTVEAMRRDAAAADSALQSDHITSGDPRTSIGRWKRDLTANQQKLCEEAFGEHLHSFGYPV